MFVPKEFLRFNGMCPPQEDPPTTEERFEPKHHWDKPAAVLGGFRITLGAPDRTLKLVAVWGNVLTQLKLKIYIKI